MTFPSNNILPANIFNLFLHPTQVHSYNTRFSETGSLNIKYSRTNQLKHSFSRFGARIWNSIPQSIRLLPKHKFKASLHQLLLHILELEDTYVDTPTLIHKLNKMTWNVKQSCNFVKLYCYNFSSSLYRLYNSIFSFPFLFLSYFPTFVFLK